MITEKDIETAGKIEEELKEFIKTNTGTGYQTETMAIATIFDFVFIKLAQHQNQITEIKDNHKRKPVTKDFGQ